MALGSELEVALRSQDGGEGTRLLVGLREDTGADGPCCLRPHRTRAGDSLAVTKPQVSLEPRQWYVTEAVRSMVVPTSRGLTSWG